MNRIVRRKEKQKESTEEKKRVKNNKTKQKKRIKSFFVMFQIQFF
jgi:hypothetical protein